MNMSHEDEIRKETGRLAQLKRAGPAAFARREQEVSRKRLAWWEANRERLSLSEIDHRFERI